MSESLGLTLLREGVVTPAELVEAHRRCSGELGTHERAHVVGALVAALARFREADDHDRLRPTRDRSERPSSLRSVS